MRQSFTLTDVEQRAFDRLPPFEGAAWAFWLRVAQARNLDVGSIISSTPKFTALPEGHDKPWCHPRPLVCAKRPPAVVEQAF